MQSKDTHLRPIVTTRESVTYAVAKVIAGILKPLVGRSQHHVHNEKHFAEQIKDITLEPREYITSYYVTALFAQVQVGTTFQVVQNKWEQDQDLNPRTKLTAQHTTELLGFSLHNTYLIFKGKFYKQMGCVAIGSPVSPIIANIYMENLNKRLLEKAENSTMLWRRYVHDAFIILLTQEELLHTYQQHRPIH